MRIESKVKKGIYDDVNILNNCTLSCNTEINAKLILPSQLTKKFKSLEGINKYYTMKGENKSHFHHMFLGG